MCDVLKIYDVGGHLLERIRSFCKDVSAAVPLKDELSESFGVGVWVRKRGCHQGILLFILAVV